jgi:GNAT superfamily N-acetyltransferase
MRRKDAVMKEQYKIRNLKAHELTIALDWAKEEGWNPGVYDAKTFFVADPFGFFAGELNGEIIAVSSAVNYDNNNAFWGLYIVKKSFRGNGYGLALSKHCYQYTRNRNLGLDGVLENVKLYERFGFKMFYKNYRYQHFPLPLHHSISKKIKPLQSIEFNKIASYDLECFPAPRTAFLKAWISQPESDAVGYIDQNMLRGFGVCRRCISGYKIGPLFADNFQIANAIFLTLQNNKGQNPIYIDIPEINQAGLELVNKYQMKAVFSTARMYLKELPEIDYNKIIAVTTFELG